LESAIDFFGRLFAGLAIAENDSLHVVLTTADRHYAVGDTIDIEMRVYDRGEPADADNITLQVSQNPNFNNPMELNLTGQGTGIYRATYTVKANDNHHNLYFFYNVSRGWDSEIVEHHEDALVINVYAVEDTVDVSFNGQKTVTARPGDVVTATVLVRTGDTPIPVTGFDHLYVEDQDGNRQNLSYRADATGIYLADFVIPDAVKTKGGLVYEFNRGATRLSAGGDLFASFSDPAGMGISDYLFQGPAGMTLPFFADLVRGV